MDVEKYQAKLDSKQNLAPNGHCRLWMDTGKICHGTQYGVINADIQVTLFSYFFLLFVNLILLFPTFFLKFLLSLLFLLFSSRTPNSEK
jgi:hypothetical protein